MTDRVAFSVLQEYSRSAVFDRIILINVPNVDIPTPLIDNPFNIGNG